MGLRQLSCYRPPDPRILSRRRRIWSRGGRTRRPDVGRGLSPQPETQHPPVGGEVLIGLVASRLRRPDQTPSGSVGVGHDHNPHGANDQPARRDRQPASCRHLRACRSIPPASLRARLATLDTSDDPARRAATTFRTRSKPPPTVPQQAARWVRTRVRRLRTTAEALDLNRICDLWHAYLGPAAAQGSGPALARRRRPIASTPPSPEQPLATAAATARGSAL